MISLARPEIAAKLGYDLDWRVTVLVPGDRRLEVPWVCQSVRSDRAEIGQPKMRALFFTYVAPSRTGRNATVRERARRLR